ncbi:hypothetical protein, partial [Mycobacterium sp.]|uniref:hypothetical protein n=1 Tax=Mycobacterium sp. TaxID=1785 RepID=UPI003C7425A8
PRQALYLANLNAYLQTRFERTGALADLDAAIEAGRAAVAAAPAGHRDRVASLVNLSNSLQLRFERAGTLADLDEAIEARRTAAAAAPVNDPNRAAIFANLASGLRTRFGRTGVLADLDAAIAAWQAAISADHPERATIFASLASGLQTRFESTAALADLDAEIEAYRSAVAAMAADYPDRAAIFVNLANGLRTRFQRAGALADLEAEIEAGQAAVDATPADHPDRGVRLTNLGNELLDRFYSAGAPADLEAAIELGRAAVDATPAGDPRRAAMLSNLGGKLQTRFERTGVQAELDDAIQVLGEAVEATADNDPQRSVALYNLGNALTDRFGRDGAQADLDQAIDVLGGAMDTETAAPWVRIRAARAASELAAALRPEWAAQLMERAVYLLPEIAPRQLQRSDQQYALGGLSGLAGDAAALVLAVTSTPLAERAALALRLLEAGRAVLLSRALEVRNDLTDLTSQHPGLAARFIRVRDLLDRSADMTFPSALPVHDDPSSSAAYPPDRAVQDRQRLAAELADILAQIRTKNGFGSFARPPSTGELLQQATAGPVVVFNVSRYRSDALLLTQDGVTSLPLPGLAMDTVATQVNAFHQALHLTADGETSSKRTAAQRQLNHILGWLWDAAAGPILDILGYGTQPGRTRHGPGCGGRREDSWACYPSTPQATTAIPQATPADAP